MTPSYVLREPVEVTRTGETVTATVPIRATEPVFPGHYPGFPVLPGVCVVECVHRAALATLPEQDLVLAAVDSARFLGPVRPGDDLTVELDWSADGDAWCCRARAGTAGGRTATVRLRYRTDPPEPADAEPSGREDAPRLGLDEITALIPHRPPMLLLDEVPALVPGERLTATRTALAGEPWGPALLIESWSQAAGVLTIHRAGAESGHVLLLGSLQGIELPGEVRQGDTVTHQVRLSRADRGAAVLTGQSVVDGRVVLRVGRVVVAVRPATELEEVG